MVFCVFSFIRALVSTTIYKAWCIVSLALVTIGVSFIDKGLMPDWLLRRVLRRSFNSKSVKRPRDVSIQHERLKRFVADLKTRAIAECAAKANEQHYEVDAQYYRIVLGPYLKYRHYL